MYEYRTLDDIIKAIDNLSEHNDGKPDNQYDKDLRADQIGDLWYEPPLLWEIYQFDNNEVWSFCEEDPCTCTSRH